MKKRTISIATALLIGTNILSGCSTKQSKTNKPTAQINTTQNRYEPTGFNTKIKGTATKGSVLKYSVNDGATKKITQKNKQHFSLSIPNDSVTQNVRFSVSKSGYKSNTKEVVIAKSPRIASYNTFQQRYNSVIKKVGGNQKIPTTYNAGNKVLLNGKVRMVANINSAGDLIGLSLSRNGDSKASFNQTSSAAVASTYALNISSKNTENAIINTLKNKDKVEPATFSQKGVKVQAIYLDPVLSISFVSTSDKLL
ncbi:hypothetical protein [Lentilactobacillus sp. SPB1-3]|uniref:Uncharacterized protein n=1 Tax=Lentilactobacillus terminaliae TaxID=3003483 RepID=A0ACD5DD18_9LACO|nr:hypothetical protein [Lentilactobacillus sp. SPB1-3]MCZ0978148.1 hypothetical protein [Lentilactobacillus sp. SPB1-3]